jgi:hypothetical protein
MSPNPSPAGAAKFADDCDQEPCRTIDVDVSLARTITWKIKAITTDSPTTDFVVGSLTTATITDNTSTPKIQPL